MKTTHQLAEELLALPNVKLIVEGWCDMEDNEPVAKMTAYDPWETAILVQSLAKEKE